MLEDALRKHQPNKRGFPAVALWRLLKPSLDYIGENRSAVKQKTQTENYYLYKVGYKWFQELVWKTLGYTGRCTDTFRKSTSYVWYLGTQIGLWKMEKVDRNGWVWIKLVKEDHIFSHATETVAQTDPNKARKMAILYEKRPPQPLTIEEEWPGAIAIWNKSNANQEKEKRPKSQSIVLGTHVKAQMFARHSAACNPGSDFGPRWKKSKQLKDAIKHRDCNATKQAVQSSQKRGGTHFNKHATSSKKQSHDVGLSVDTIRRHLSSSKNYYVQQQGIVVAHDVDGPTANKIRAELRDHPSLNGVRLLETRKSIQRRKTEKKQEGRYLIGRQLPNAIVPRKWAKLHYHVGGPGDKTRRVKEELDERVRKPEAPPRPTNISSMTRVKGENTPLEGTITECRAMTTPSGKKVPYLVHYAGYDPLWAQTNLRILLQKHGVDPFLIDACYRQIKRFPKVQNAKRRPNWVDGKPRPYKDQNGVPLTFSNSKRRAAGHNRYYRKRVNRIPGRSPIWRKEETKRAVNET
jgi:hypothetical protein